MALIKLIHYPLGVDISATAVKIVQLEKKGGGIILRAYGKRALSPGTVENGVVVNPDELAHAISEIILRPSFGKFNSSVVISGLPEAKTFLKLIEIEKSPNPLATLVEAEIQKHVPYTINEIYFDWNKIGEGGEYDRILFGACQKNIADRLTEIFKKCKLAVEAIEPEALAVCRALLDDESPNKEPGAATIALIDIGAKQTHMIFYSQGSVLFSISLPLSGREITNEIQKALDINEDQAEKAKIVCGLDDNIAQGVIKKIMSDMIVTLIARIKETIAYYEKNFPGYGNLAKIILTGGGANIKNLDLLLKQEITVETEIGNPLLKIKLDPRDKNSALKETHHFSPSGKDNPSEQLAITQDNGNAYALAIGLALRGIYFE